MPKERTAKKRQVADEVQGLVPTAFVRGAEAFWIHHSILGETNGVLERGAANEAHDASDREHVTPYIYRNASRFLIRNVAAPDNRYEGVTLTVDYERDLDMAEWVAARLEMPIASASFVRIVALRRAWQAVAAKN